MDIYMCSYFALLFNCLVRANVVYFYINFSIISVLIQIMIISTDLVLCG